MNKKELLKKVRPYWKERSEEYDTFIQKQRKIEVRMNKELQKELKAELEFFYVDGECVGIGAANFKKRDKIPLLHDSELG